MQQPEKKTLDYGNVKMSYYVTGEGRPLILMHGWGCNASTVDSMARNAVASGWKVYNVDFPGFGSSDEPDTVWGVEEYTRLIEKLVACEGMESPALVGHSFGGRVAILFASRNSADRIILVDAAGVKPSMTFRKFCKIYSFKLMKNILKTLLPKDKYEQRVEAMRKKRGSADYASSSPMMRSVLSKVVNEDLRRFMPQIKSPTLLLWGVNDTATPLRDARIMERLIPDAGLVKFENAGHYSFLDSPHEFFPVYNHFLKHS